MRYDHIDRGHTKIGTHRYRDIQRWDTWRGGHIDIGTYRDGDT